MLMNVLRASSSIKLTNTGRLSNIPRLRGIDKEIYMKQFSYSDINHLSGESHHWFDCSMISTCAPAFDDCDSNHDVEDILKRAKVIHPKNLTDSESCALVIEFKSKKSGEKFIDRLNTYLKLRS